jgi:flagellar motor switch/type III secretory pathway protein FliN
MSEVRPIHLPGTSAMSMVLERVRSALTAWAREWVSGWANDEQRLAALNVESVWKVDQRPAQEFEGLHGAHGHVWFRRGTLDRLNFDRAVVGIELMPRSIYADDWIAGVVEHAWTARNRALCEALVGEPRSSRSTQNSEWPASLMSVGSGAVKISCEPLGLHAIADAGVWTLLPPPERKSARLPTIQLLESAVQRANLRIEVMLGSVALDLPKIMDLRCGDVLRLPARLDEPLTVTCEGKPFARAVLGAAAGRKTIQITGNQQ